jgi:S-adenosylmethionine-diacylglycerol 3-amino-3-carboxypropyl transferase
VSQSSDIGFSQVREDPLIDQRVVELVACRLGRPVRVLLIASGGCTALSLLALDAVEAVVAVDASRAQIHLVELRRSAMAELSAASQRRFLGADAASPAERREAYAMLRPRVPEAARAHWDARPSEIEAGVLHAGRFEWLFRELAAALRDAGLDPLGRPDEAVQSPRFVEVFDRVFERSALTRLFGPAAVDYSMDRSFGEHFASAFAAALRRWPAGENYFLHQVFEGRYLDAPGGCPPCLEERAHAAAVARGLDRLELRTLRFDEALTALAGEPPFDLIQTSNISDWMPVPNLRAMLARARAVLAPGGAVLGRRLNGDHRLSDVFADVLEVDASLSEDLRASDRSFFYGEVVVGFRPEARP